MNQEPLNTEADSAENPAESGKLRILVVDDSATIRRSAETMLTSEGCEVITAENGRPAGLITITMRLLPGNVLFTTLAMRKNCQKVALGATRHKQGGFLARQACGQFLQTIDRWILAIDIIAEFCGKHGSAHLFSRPGDCVATQIDDFHIDLFSRGSVLLGTR